MKKEILRLEYITKTFYRERVLNNAKLNLFNGEILGLVGLNGAGKTTLAKIAAGIFACDSGTIFFNEQNIEEEDISLLKKNVFYLDKYMQLISNLSLTDNIFIGNKFKYNNFFINYNKSCIEAENILSMLGLNINPRIKAENLTSMLQHLILIAKAIANGSQIIIFDDITEFYNQLDFNTFKTVLKTLLLNNSMSIIFLSNDIDSVLDITDRIIVMRDGRTVGIFNSKNTTKSQLIPLISGNILADSFTKESRIATKKFLDIKELNTDILKNINISIFHNEILGFYYHRDSGINQLIDILIGNKRIGNGTIFINNKPVRLRSKRDAKKNGIGLIIRDNAETILFPNMNVSENISFLLVNKLSKLFIAVNKKFENYISDEHLKSIYGFSLNDVNSEKKITKEAETKISILQWLLVKPKLLILDHPFINLDLIAKKEIFALLEKAVKNGVSIVLITSDISEILSICDRLIVMRNGSIKDVFSRDQFSKNKIFKAVTS